MSTPIQAYVASQNGLRGPTAGGAIYPELDYDASGSVAIAGENAVIGWQSANLGVGANSVLGNTVLLDGARSEYALQVDSSGALNILDSSTGNPTSGQTISVNGAAYAIFDGGAQNPSNGYQSIAFIENAAGSALVALYQAALGRVPDLPGLEYWQAQMVRGMSIETIAQDFLNSSEFASHVINPTTSSNAQYIAALYQNVLGRAGDGAGVTYWTAQLTGGESRADVLLGFANSAENLNDISATNGGWLIDTALGGFADAANPIPVLTFLAEGLQDKYFNLADVSATASGSSGINGSSPAAAINLKQMTINGNSAVVIYLSSLTINSVNDADSGDFIYSAAAGSSKVAATDSTIYLYGTHNVVSSLGSGSSIYGFVSSDTLALGPWSILSATLSTPTTKAPLLGSSLSFGTTALGGSTTITVVELGAVGGGSAAEVAAAANKVYTVADADHEALILVGQTTAGNTVVDYWGSTQSAANTQADTNGNHLVDARELTCSLTLVGVLPSSLTAANFHS